MPQRTTPPGVLRVDKPVEIDSAQSIKQGELRPAIAAGTVTDPERYAELGQIIAGQKPGRASEPDITVCDLTGTGVQDTAIATLAAANAGTAGTTITIILRF